MKRLTHKSRSEAGYKENRGVPVWECIDKLGHLEDLADQGRLLELPCAVGDMALLSNGTILPVIYITSAASGIEVGLQNGIRISQNTTYRAAGYYRTREEAREALERMEDGNETDRRR